MLGVVEELRAEPSLVGLRVEVLHGRMAPEDKDAVMQAFAAREVDVLVSTTVIEVGVDVPNATVMVVMDAERFGVSQLHQLRGRVGRGEAARALPADDRDRAGPSLERLEAVAATTDGFALARLDLEQRREGDVLGAAPERWPLPAAAAAPAASTRTSSCRPARTRSRSSATTRRWSEHPVLRELVASALDEEQAAYLERG